MNDEEVRMEEEDEVLEVMARHWEEPGRSSLDDVVPDTEMEDMGGCELGMCKEISRKEMFEVRRVKAPDPDGALIKMVMYGGGRLMKMMLQVMNLVL